MSAKFDWTKRKWNDRQRLFVMEYLVDKNMKQAAIRAGYSEATAEKIGPQLYHKPHIYEAIQWHLDNMMQNIEITAERILQEIAMTAFLDPREAFKGNANIDVDKMPEHVARAIDSIQIRYLDNGDIVHNIQFNPKMKGLELLGKNFKLFTDKVEIADRPMVIVRDFTGRNKKAKAQESE